LQNNIISHLDIPSTLKLRLTNRHFHTLNPYPTHVTLLLVERTPWAVAPNLYRCMDCLRLRFQEKFAPAMLHGPKGKNGKEPQKRFCVECGLKRPRSRYAPGAEIVVEGRDICFVKSVGCIVERWGVLGLGAGCVRVVIGRWGVARCVGIRRGGRGSSGGNGKGKGKGIFGGALGAQ
ncbi:hypothetical protein BGZ57DRAFT_772259, partial [Hyaloscypha finlandica]